MNIKKHIPNIITLLNLFCGCIAVVFAVNRILKWLSILYVLVFFWTFSMVFLPDYSKFPVRWVCSWIRLPIWLPVELFPVS